MDIGITGKQTIVVEKPMTAEVVGSGQLPVFATPCMIALMENTASGSVAPYLEEGQDTVGTCVRVEHVSATPVGMTVTCETKLTEIDGRRLIFQVKACDEAGLIGEGIHERTIINVQRFVERAQAKRPAESK